MKRLVKKNQSQKTKLNPNKNLIDARLSFELDLKQLAPVRVSQISGCPHASLDQVGPLNLQSQAAVLVVPGAVVLSKLNVEEYLQKEMDI